MYHVITFAIYHVSIATVACRPSCEIPLTALFLDCPTASSMDTPTGTTQLPSARIRKLIALDPDIATISADALFVISIATELFVKEMVMLARKQAMDQGRKGIHYKDMGMWRVCVLREWK